MRMYETGERKGAKSWDRSPVWGRREEGEERREICFVGRSCEELRGCVQEGGETCVRPRGVLESDVWLDWLADSTIPNSGMLSLG